MKIINGILTFNSDKEFITKTYNNKVKIKNYMFEKIKIALELGIEQVYLFKIDNSPSLVLNIKAKEYEWISILEKCKDFFEETEEYLKCNECLKMIRLIKEKTTYFRAGGLDLN